MLGGGHPGRIVKISCETDKQKLHHLMSKGLAIVHGHRPSSSSYLSSSHSHSSTQSIYQEMNQSHDDDRMNI